MMFLSLPAIVRVAVLAAIALPSAFAQTKPPAREVGRDELRVCMNSEVDLKARRQAMDARQKQNGEEVVGIRAEAAAMTEEQKGIREDEQSRKDKFNAKVKAHNERIRLASAEVESYRRDLEALNKSLIAYNEQCGGITFRTSDKEAILKERESAAPK